MSVQQVSQTIRLEPSLAQYPELRGSYCDILALNARAVESLCALFDPARQMFSERANFESGRLVRHDISQRSSLVALLGLHRLSQQTASIPFDLGDLRRKIIPKTAWVSSLADLGLLTWVTAECAPDLLETLFSDFDFADTVQRYRDAAEGQTRAWSLFLAGLAHAQLAASEETPDLTDVAVDAYQRLQRNQAESGLFAHRRASGSFTGMFRSGFGTFEDQVHAIHALARFAAAFAVEEPLESALNCANSICALQGKMGEWWPTYQPRKGVVLRSYPLNSANQCAIGPLGLLAVQDASGQSFGEPISKGLGCDVRLTGETIQDARENLYTEKAYLESLEVSTDSGGWSEAILRSMNGTRTRERKRIRLHTEVRADHCGWVICVFAGYGLPKANYIVASATP